MKTVVITSNTSWYLYNFRKNTILALLESGYRVIAVAPKDEYSQKLEELGAGYHHVGIDQANEYLSFGLVGLHRGQKRASR